MCQFKFFIKYYLKLVPIYTAKALINGSAFHEGKATFYLTHSKKKAMTVCKNEIISRELEFEYEEDYISVYKRCPILLDYWIDKLGYDDLEYFTPYMVEEELRFKLGNGSHAFITLRPDTILKSKKTGKLFGMETKTSSFSKKLAILGVENGDQATTYWAGLQEHLHGENIECILADVAYWNKSSDDEANIDCVRSAPIVRYPEDIRQYKASTAQLFYEMSTKVQAVVAGHDPYTLFKRNTSHCNSFFKPCEYLPICRKQGLCDGFRSYKRYGLKKDRANPLKNFSAYTATVDNLM